MIKELTRSGQPPAMPLTQAVLLQHQRLLDNLIQDRKGQVEILLALQEVVNFRVLFVYDTLALVLDIPLGYSVDELDLLDEIIAHCCNKLAFLLQALIENILLPILLYDVI